MGSSRLMVRHDVHYLDENIMKEMTRGYFDTKNNENEVQSE